MQVESDVEDFVITEAGAVFTLSENGLIKKIGTQTSRSLITLEYKIPEEASGQLHFYRLAAHGGYIVVYGAFKAVDKYADRIPVELRKTPNALTDKPVIGAHNFYLFDEELKYKDIFDVTMKVADIE